MAPFTLERTVLAERGPETRECSACPPFVACAHFGNQVVRMSIPDVWAAHLRACPHHVGGFADCIIVARYELSPDVRQRPDCPEWTDTPVSVAWSSWRMFTDEDAARAEFDRQVALMLAEAA